MRNLFHRQSVQPLAFGLFLLFFFFFVVVVQLPSQLHNVSVWLTTWNCITHCAVIYFFSLSTNNIELSFAALLPGCPSAHLPLRLSYKLCTIHSFGIYNWFILRFSFCRQVSISTIQALKLCPVAVSVALAVQQTGTHTHSFCLHTYKTIKWVLVSFFLTSAT